RRPALGGIGGAGDRDRGRDVHRFRQRPGRSHHRSAAGAAREKHVWRESVGGHLGICTEVAVPAHRAAHCSLEREIKMRVIEPMMELALPAKPFVPGPAGTHIPIRGLTKYFAGWPLYENFNLDIPKGKIVSVFGPNGCGKSTLINMIAGLIPIDSGEILFDGKSLAQTKIGYVFQYYREAMFPWMRTIDNIAYPLVLEGKSKAEVDRRMEELVASFDVKFDLNRYPYELSGGQQQTASIMRA